MGARLTTYTNTPLPHSSHVPKRSTYVKRLRRWKMGAMRPTVQSHWRSLEPTLIDRLLVTCYQWLLVTIGLYLAVSEINVGFCWKSQLFPPLTFSARAMDVSLQFCNGTGDHKLEGCHYRAVAKGWRWVYSYWSPTSFPPFPYHALFSLFSSRLPSFSLPFSLVQVVGLGSAVSSPSGVQCWASAANV